MQKNNKESRQKRGKMMKEQAQRKGSFNPMHGKRHSLETKRKISDTQKKRYQAIRKALHEHDILQMADTSDNARKEIIRQLLYDNDIEFANIQQVLTFLAIILGKDHIQKVVREEIDRLVLSIEQG